MAMIKALPAMLISGIACLCFDVGAQAQTTPSYGLKSTQQRVEQISDLKSQPAPLAIPLITGYSLLSEVDPHVLPESGIITLDSKLPEVVLYFGNSGGATQPWEYRYRLKYSGDDWTETRNKLVHYRNLRPGQYRFEVQTRLLGQEWSSEAAFIAVTQRAFFYQTWLFYLLLATGLFGLVAAILQQRDRLLKGQIGMVLEERNRIASDCHDTLMAGFAAISWQMEATTKLFAPESSKCVEASESLELARKMVAHCQAEARRIIWNLRDSDEVIEGLPNALARTVNAVAPAVGTRLALSIEGNEIPINPGAVHHLVCIAQEAITNALRHAAPSEISVCLRYEMDLLCLTVCDNGTGFPEVRGSSTVGHFGIALMEERSRKLRANLRIRRVGDEVTEVSVTLGLLSSTSPAMNRQVVPWIGV